MTRFGWLVLITVLLVLTVIIGGWYLIMRYHPPAALVQSMATTTPQEQDLSGSSIYANGVYGFSLIYPAKDAVAETFASWRSGAVATGTPLVSVTDADGVLRIGASANAKELKACVKAGPAESVLADMKLGSTTFKAFTRDDVGTDRQQRITSYRAIHENACVAIETFQPLQGDTVATSSSLSGTLASFSFARP